MHVKMLAHTVHAYSAIITNCTRFSSAKPVAKTTIIYHGAVYTLDKEYRKVGMGSVKILYTIKSLAWLGCNRTWNIDLYIGLRLLRPQDYIYSPVQI